MSSAGLIVFLMPVATQPRYRKRVVSLIAEGMSAKCLYFERDYFEGHGMPCKSFCVGRLEHGKYLNRMFTLIAAIFKVRSLSRGSTHFYVFGMDMLFLAVLSGFFSDRKIVYEVSDIRDSVLGGGIGPRIIRAVEKLLMRWVHLVVVTSPDYRDGYYKSFGIASKSNFFVLENKLNIAPSERPPHRSFDQMGDNLGLIGQDRPITIGYFGLLRCPVSWMVLKNLVHAAGGRFKVVVRGHPINPSSLSEDAAELKDVEFGGQFIWPDDLPSMYGRVDLVWGCYPYSDEPVGNWQWARTNRFYEACFFRRPIIALKGSADAILVQELQMGLAIDLSDIDRAVNQMLAIDWKQIELWQAGANLAPDEACTYTDEHKRLVLAMAAEPSSVSR